MVIAAICALPIGVSAQPKNHIGQPLAEVFVANGCAMSEEAAASALMAQGWQQSDFQAQILALHRGGYVGRNSEGLLQLKNWGNSC